MIWKRTSPGLGVKDDTVIKIFKTKYLPAGLDF
jgi:hypothetical protein